MSTSKANPANGFAALAGQFVLQPGQREAIVGGRPIAGADFLGTLLRGQRCTAAQARLGHVFTLCAHAHQRACALAFAAAGPSTAAAPHPPAPTLPLALLRWETARDHLLSIALEWPQRLGEPALHSAAMDWLNGRAPNQPPHASAPLTSRVPTRRAPIACPIPLTGAPPLSAAQVGADLAALRDWLAQPADFPDQCLARWQAQAKNLQLPLRALHVLNDDPTTQQRQLRAVGQALASDPGFAHRPQWQGACAETGPWTRLRHTRQGAIPHAASAWTRLQARWLELQDIAAAPALATDATHDPLLSSGALNLGEGQSIAWCEMARGLLVHWVQLDGHGAVAQYRVLAPTEWNFHPHGALALGLAALGAKDSAAAHTLAAAFDPCVAYRVAMPAPEETVHA